MAKKHEAAPAAVRTVPEVDKTLGGRKGDDGAPVWALHTVKGGGLRLEIGTGSCSGSKEHLLAVAVADLARPDQEAIAKLLGLALPEPEVVEDADVEMEADDEADVPVESLELDADAPPEPEPEPEPDDLAE